MTTFQPSPQQQAFFSAVADTQHNLILHACAGAGKTTTLVQALKYMSGGKDVIFFGAFNKSAAIDIRAKVERTYGDVRRGLFISTMHAAGFKAWMQSYPDAKVSERKVFDIIDKLAEEGDVRLRDMAVFISKTISFGKQMLAAVKWDVGNFDHWRKLVEHFGVYNDLPEDIEVDEALQRVVNIFRISADTCPAAIDFDDMIWAPLAYNSRFYPHDFVIIDEAQDTNPARRELARRLLRRGSGRLIAVGDERQAIYGFTGADSDALELISKEFRCMHLPLSVTYRCPKAVVAHAHHFVPATHIQAHETAPEGIVRDATLDMPAPGAKPKPWYLVETLTRDDVILCRYNRPLVETAYKLLKEGIACKMEGRDIGRGLIVLCNRFKARTLDQLEVKLTRWQAREVLKAQAKKSKSMEQSAIDRFYTLMIFVERCRAKGNNTTACVVAEIEALFADNVTGVLTLASGHKAKGREWSRVFWIQMQEPGWEMKDWEVLAESNIKYVISTRAQSELVMVPAPEAKNGG